MPNPSESKLAISKDYLAGYWSVPPGVRERVGEFTRALRRGAGPELERVDGVADDSVRRAALGDGYSAYVVEAPAGDVTVAVWVGEEPGGLDWVRERRFGVNEYSGAFQSYDPRMFEVEAGRDGPSLFEGIEDVWLERLGFPRELLPWIRSLQSPEGIRHVAHHVPVECFEILALVAGGEDFFDALDIVSDGDASTTEGNANSGAAATGAVDTDDVASALERDASRQGYLLIEEDEDLDLVLARSFEEWRVFLHPTQRKLVRWRTNGAARVLGGAGTGKTSVLLHRARFLAREVFTSPKDRVLVTTFLTNLAKDLETNLRSLCGDEFERIEVRGLHDWAHEYLAEQGIRLDCVSDQVLRGWVLEAATKLDALGLPPSFYVGEWERVIRINEITTRDEYLRARRVGCGTPVSLEQREKIWPIFESYQQILRESGKHEWRDLIRRAREHIEQTGATFPYRSILVDEVQDHSTSDLKLIRALVPEGPDDLFLVGDARQRIYGETIPLSQCGIEIRGRSRRLTLNYRTTQKVREFASYILGSESFDDLDGAPLDQAPATSLRVGTEPQFGHFDDAESEAAFIASELRSWLKEVPAEELCVGTRRTGDVAHYARVLEAAGIEHYVQTQNPDRSAPGVRVSTIHRMKGLEYRRVIVAGIRGGTLPRPSERNHDDESRREWEKRERSILHVACTRARDELLVTGFGRESSLLWEVRRKLGQFSVEPVRIALRKGGEEVGEVRFSAERRGLMACDVAWDLRDAAVAAELEQALLLNREDIQVIEEDEPDQAKKTKQKQPDDISMYADAIVEAASRVGGRHGIELDVEPQWARGAEGRGAS